MNDPPIVLHVEDNAAHARLTQEAFTQNSIPVAFHHVATGEEALAFLRRRRDERPAFMLLDLRLPDRSGHEILAEIRADAELRSLPVVILSVSDAPEDVTKAYDGHANCYLTKPARFEDFVSKVQDLKRFWLSLVELPEASRA